MKLPESIRILGLDYEVIGIDRNGLEGVQIGQFTSGQLKIHIDQNLPPAVLAATLLHECIEAANYHLELDLPHNVIQSLDGILTQIARDNVDFWRSIAK